MDKDKEKELLSEHAHLPVASTHPMQWVSTDQLMKRRSQPAIKLRDVATCTIGLDITGCRDCHSALQALHTCCVASKTRSVQSASEGTQTINMQSLKCHTEDGIHAFMHCAKYKNLFLCTSMHLFLCKSVDSDSTRTALADLITKHPATPH
jgi:hypothetical protein